MDWHKAYNSDAFPKNVGGFIISHARIIYGSTTGDTEINAVILFAVDTSYLVLR